MHNVEKYLEEVSFNLDNKYNELIKSFKDLENVKFPEDAAVLVAWTSFSLGDVNLFLEANEDMFDSVDPVDEDSEYTDSVVLLNDFALYDKDSKNFNEYEEEIFSEFYSVNDLEKNTIKLYGDWVKKCFDKAQITLGLPIYFRILDEEDALNLVTGEWENQMEIEI